MVASFVPSDADLLTLVETTAKHSSREQSDANIGQRWQRSSRVVALVMLDEILLAIEDAATAKHYALPILSRLVHPHLVLFPIRFSLERLLQFGFGTICTEHVGLARLTL